MKFTLYDALTNGAAVGGPLTNAAVVVSNGLCTVQLDFGAGVFLGADRWLGIGLRTNGSAGAFSTFNPRQPLTAAPYATYASGVSAAGISGTIAGANIADGSIISSKLAAGSVGSSQLAANAVGTAQIADGSIAAADLAANIGSSLTGLNASSLASGTVPDARLSGNVALRAAANTFSTGPQLLLTGADGNQGLIVRATNPSQGANLQSWQNSAGVALAVVTASGGLVTGPQLLLTGGDGNEGLTVQASGPGQSAYLQSWRNSAGTIVAGVTIGGVFNGSSDRNAKEHFAPVNPRDVLAKVAALPISRWNYKSESDVTHLGPMAQDFYSAFTVGTDNKHISMVDADGVALAAIQGLNQRLEEAVQEKEARIRALEQTVAELKALVNQLAARQNAGAP